MEMLSIYNKEREYLGVATRDEVHAKGLWHETFHCWILTKIDGKDYLYFQLRSKEKQDYPELLDITAAGHLMAQEKVEDGIREMEEEIGINVAIDELTYLGIIPYEKELLGFIDREHAHVFLLERTIPFDHFTLQPEEVSGVFLVGLEDFLDLWANNEESIYIEGFVENSTIVKKQVVSKEHFVPHSDQFYRRTMEAIMEKRGKMND
ncbi:NUDIX hydrolase [Sutcliffiella rhizosphaerae]|uniref:Isopentenyl-diphosphate Delta-isomerase n=1 Tax=Sutcliffiella rhizosphaerae TaxID=2880967 RepID=A0ABN8ALC6_9BACI|nr:NUDIX domain-containing protein [Sutcliffiella rhizosphaerae]CAG9623710.1 Isopentenyl-diphosphate Delta-isomerase [Sutcliffiella rhizosphaerae]